jgi:hypothetical protein
MALIYLIFQLKIQIMEERNEDEVKQHWVRMESLAKTEVDNNYLDHNICCEWNMSTIVDVILEE